jgi:carbon-monoxide dehydrogenase large subunit
VGEAVALVIAETRALAEDAAAMVMIDYEPLQAVVDWRNALEPGSFVAHEGAPDNLAAQLRATFGNSDTVFASAAHVFRECFETHRGGCHAMELPCHGMPWGSGSARPAR